MRQTALYVMFHHHKIYDSPTCHDVETITSFDENGDKVISRCDVDYKSIIESNGDVSNWSLESLQKAGINPDFPIRTGFSSRFDGIETISKFDQIASDIINESKPE